MTTSVRVYSHKGLSQPKVNAGSGRFSTDSVMMLQQPYLVGEVLSAGSEAVSSAAATTPKGTQLIHVQVQVGKRVHYELTPSGHTARTATTDSPIIEGNVQLEAYEGWTISVLEAASDA